MPQYKNNDGCNLSAATDQDIEYATEVGLRPFVSTQLFYRDLVAGCPLCEEKGIVRAENGAFCLDELCGSYVVDGVVTSLLSSNQKTATKDHRLFSF